MESNPTFVPVVAAALVDGQGRVLMQQRPRHKTHGGLWEFPGGKVEAGETLEEALIRELHEELAVELDGDALVPVSFASRPDQPHVVLLYRCTGWRGDPAAREGQRFAWFTPEALQELAMPPLDVPLAQALFAALRTAK